MTNETQKLKEAMMKAVEKLKKVELHLASEAGYGQTGGRCSISRTVGDVATDLKIAATGRKGAFSTQKSSPNKKDNNNLMHP